MSMEYFECCCHSSEHRLVFNFDEDYNQDWPPELYADVYLNQYNNIFKRMWIATKYIFGYKCRYGHFDCFLMKPEDVPRFNELINKYTDAHNKWIKDLKNKSKG